jgi:hypothetical protein
MAKSTSLFPDPPFHITPASDRTEPRVWVRRLVVVAERSPAGEVIREVRFRRGLNVVRVEDRPPGDGRIIAHSVGKTLLTRLIRYCLGEQHFALQDRTEVISTKFPTAYALAEIFAHGRSWVVARPLRDGKAADSFAVEADDWTAGLAPAGELGRFTAFTQAVEEQAFAGLPELKLPAAGREPRWLDVVAWMGRDAECKYQHPHEWHTPLARSGTARLDVPDASLLTCWVMGVLGTEDIAEQQKRQQLTEQRDTAKAAAERLRRRTDALEPILTARFGVAAEELSSGLFGDQAQGVIDRTRDTLRTRRTDAQVGSRLGELQEEMVRTTAEVRVTENEIKRVEGLQREAEGDLRQLRSSTLSAEQLYASCDRRVCPLELSDCKYHPKNATTVPDEDRDARIATRQADYVRHAERVNELTAALPRLQKAATSASDAYTAARDARDDTIRAIDTEIGRWDELEEQFRGYTADVQSAEREQKKVEKAERNIRDSQEQQRADRAERDQQVRELSRLYDETLKRLIGPDAGGVVRRDARGLHPVPDEMTAPGGATLGSLAQVVALDLAYLAAYLSGFGQLPGFLIHDSPESIVMESALYDRLLRFAVELETACGDRGVGFQYIVTTTAPPPAEIAGEPYAVLTLDARSDATRLLRSSF